MISSLSVVNSEHDHPEAKNIAQDPSFDQSRHVTSPGLVSLYLLRHVCAQRMVHCHNLPYSLTAAMMDTLENNICQVFDDRAQNE